MGKISLAGEHDKPARAEQADAESTPRQYPDAKREQATPQDRQTTYVDEVGEIQSGSVDVFIDVAAGFLFVTIRSHR